jgi:hypothetical protein
MSDRTRAAYDAAFQAERLVEYPVMDALEARFGYAVDRQRLEDAARVLACPLKKNPPNWQHGRLVYALGRHYLAGRTEMQTWLDIGTAKGFSACCMSWALKDAGMDGGVLSWDIIDPQSREPRNSVEDGKTVAEFVDPFWAKGVIAGFCHYGRMRDIGMHIGLAFVDGSHTYEGVKADIETIAPRQQPGDIMLFDDLQVTGVATAIAHCLKGYDIEQIDLLPKRQYAIAVKR